MIDEVKKMFEVTNELVEAGARALADAGDDANEWYSYLYDARIVLNAASKELRSLSNAEHVAVKNEQICEASDRAHVPSAMSCHMVKAFELTADEERAFDALFEFCQNGHGAYIEDAQAALARAEATLGPTERERKLQCELTQLKEMAIEPLNERQRHRIEQARMYCVGNSLGEDALRDVIAIIDERFPKPTQPADPFEALERACEEHERTGCGIPAHLIRAVRDAQRHR